MVEPRPDSSTRQVTDKCSLYAVDTIDVPLSEAKTQSCNVVEVQAQDRISHGGGALRSHGCDNSAQLTGDETGDCRVSQPAHPTQSGNPISKFIGSNFMAPSLLSQQPTPPISRQHGRKQEEFSTKPHRSLWADVACSEAPCASDPPVPPAL